MKYKLKNKFLVYLKFLIYLFIMCKFKIFIIIIFIALNCRISNKNKGGYDISYNEYEYNKEIKTLNEGLFYESINNYLLKVYPNTFLKLKNNYIDLVYGKIFYIKNIKSNYKNSLLNFDIDNKIILDNEHGKVCFYRLKLPNRLKFNSEVDIIYNIIVNDKIVEKKLTSKLNFIFSSNKEKYYGFFIPLNVYWNLSSYKIHIKLNVKNNLFYEIKHEIQVPQKAWEKQSINFTKKKYLELNNYNKIKYTTEKKEREKIYNLFNPELFINDYCLPVEKIAITSEFGLIREWKLYKKTFSKDIHNGLDLANALDTEVYAPGNGIIKVAKPCELLGNLIIIDHGFSIYSEYYHLNKILVNEGLFVKKGDIIGTIGMTGASTGYHLHWGLRINGFSVDPRSLLKIKEIYLP